MCHAVWEAANVFDVVEKVCTVTTNFLKFCRASSARLALALAAGVLDVDCVAGEGRIYTGSGEDAAGSGLFLGWAMALGSKFMGIG